MDIVKLYRDFGVDYRTEGTKHNRPGWVNTPCPFCSGNPGYHLGYCIDVNSTFYKRFVCWRCGGKKTWETLSRLLKIEDSIQIKTIWTLYGGKASSKIYRKPTKKKDLKKQAILPRNTTELARIKGACTYLQKRGFNWRKLEKTWGILATGPSAILPLEEPGKSLDFSYRIIIPILRGGRIVSYQGRDWTGKQGLKYIACPPEKEAYPIKKTLYGLDEAEGMEEVYIVEGVTDVWRMGSGWLSLFGAKYTKDQVREIAKFKKVTIVLDPDEAGKLNSRKLCADLRENLLEVRIITLKDKDIAELPKNQVLKIIRGEEL